jgi:hypothetical protein
MDIENLKSNGGWSMNTVISSHFAFIFSHHFLHQSSVSRNGGSRSSQISKMKP